ncbi:MAG: hypothetical protein V1918_02080, partial [Planctomycetota bacterium]
PGPGGDARGVGPAFAFNRRYIRRLRWPMVIVVLGVGGWGGALGIGVGDRVLMLQHAYYSVISPEGCAAILWRDASKAPEAAAALRITSRDLKEFGIIDEALVEPLGGAHKDPEAMGQVLHDALIRHLDELVRIPTEALLESRYARLRAVGEYEVASDERLRQILGRERSIGPREALTPAE